MKSEKKVLITSALTLLQERDPDWKHPKMQRQFKTLYLGWRQAELRANRKSCGLRCMPRLSIPSRGDEDGCRKPILCALETT